MPLDNPLNPIDEEALRALQQQGALDLSAMPAAQPAQPVLPAVQPQVDQSIPDPSQILPQSQPSPMVEPTAPPVLPDLGGQRKSDIAQLQKQAESEGKIGFGDVMLQILSATPRGGRIAAAIKGLKPAHEISAATKLQQLLHQDEFEKEYALKQNKDTREELAFRNEHQFDESDKDPASARSQIAQQAAVTMFPQAKDLIANMSRAEIANYVGGSPLEKIFTEKEQDVRSAASLAEQKREHDLMAQARQDTLTEKSSKQKNIGADTLNKEVAKDYATWTAGGGDSAAKSGIDAIEKAKKILTKNPNVSGRALGMLSAKQRATLNPTAGAVEQMVSSAILPTMKTLFGGRITQLEVQKALETYYNPSLPAATNIQSLTRLQNKIAEGAKSKQEAFDYFQNNGGSMEGFKGKNFNPTDFLSGGSEEKKTQGGPPQAPESHMIRMLAPDGSIRMVKDTDKEKAIKAGGKVL